MLGRHRGQDVVETIVAPLKEGGVEAGALAEHGVGQVAKEIHVIGVSEPKPEGLASRAVISMLCSQVMCVWMTVSAFSG